MKTMKLITLSALTCLGLGGLLLGGTAQPALAQKATRDVSHVVDKLPGNVESLLDLYMPSPNSSDTDFMNNNTVGNILSSPDQTDQPDNNDGMSFQYLAMGGAHYFMSSWPLKVDQDQYKMDFTKQFSGKFFLDFGDKTIKDGITFTMHNDPADAKALTKAVGQVDGQNLGVAGGRDDRQPEKQAIQNSVAIGFDLKDNADSFDGQIYNVNRGLTSPHIAYTFPSDKYEYAYSQYTKDQHATLKHHDAQSLTKVASEIRNNHWYVFDFTYGDQDHDGNNEFSYKLSDPNDTSKAVTGTISAGDLFQQLDLKDHNYKASWGFTSGNDEAADIPSEESENSLKHVIKSVPAFGGMPIPFENDNNPKPFPEIDVTTVGQINAHDSVLKYGATWQAQDNFDSAWVNHNYGDKMQNVAFKDLTTTVKYNDAKVDKVDTTQPGEYEVTYEFTDDAGQLITKTIVVTVLEQEKPTDPSTPTDPETPTEPEQPTEPGQPNQPNNGKPFKVYTKTSINEYSSDVFTAKTKRQHYVAKKRVYAPIFTVKKVVTNKNGRDRYLLSNGHYITANQDNVNYLYWQGEDYAQLYVIHPLGTYEYKSKTFAKKNRVKLHHQGETLKVKRVVQNGLTTRYQLTNGNYITGNKQWTSVNKWAQPQQVQARGALNVYQTANLTGKVKHYKAKDKQVFTVKGFDYSNGFANKGYTLRYKVAGGYISGNPKLVKITKP